MITNFDFMVLNAIQTVRGSFMDGLMIFFTYLGSTGVAWLIPALILICRKTTRRQGIVVLVSMGLGLLLGNVMKLIIMRPRPFNFPQALIAAEALSIPAPFGKWSFPSVHTVSAFAAATGIFFAHKRWGIAALVLAAVIGFSRLYLYVHFLTDVAAGAALGVLCAFAGRKIVKLIFERV